MDLIDKEEIKSRSKTKTKEKDSKDKEIKQERKERKEYTEESLRKYAELVINERIKFCQEYKKDEDLDKCIRESVIRWIRLFENRPMEGSKELGKLRVQMVEKVFGEMIKEGKIKGE